MSDKRFVILSAEYEQEQAEIEHSIIKLQSSLEAFENANRGGGRMKTSVCMDEIRKIRDENSLRHLSQTPEERSKELAESMEWFLAAIGKPVKVVKLENGIQ